MEIIINMEDSISTCLSANDYKRVIEESRIRFRKTKRFILNLQLIHSLPRTISKEDICVSDDGSEIWANWQVMNDNATSDYCHNREMERLTFESFLSIIQSSYPNFFYDPKYILCNESSKYRRSEPPYILAFYHTNQIGSYRGEDSGAYYPINERCIDVCYDVTERINEVIDGTPLVEYYWQVQNDGAVTIPTSRHTIITEWLLDHRELIVPNENMTQYEGEY